MNDIDLTYEDDRRDLHREERRLAIKALPAPPKQLTYQPT